MVKQILSRPSSLALAVVVFLAVCFSYLMMHPREQKIMAMRMADMRILITIYLANTNIITTADMVSALKQRNIVLKRPIPEDPSKICFKVSNESPESRQAIFVNQIVIEEVNVRDPHQTVVAEGDGTIYVR